MAKVHLRPHAMGWLRRRRVMATFAAASLGYALHARAVPVPFPETPLPGNASFSTFSNTVRALLIHSDTLYVGGNFRVTQGSLTRTNLAAFDLNGNLKAAFQAEPNDTVLALATDGTSLFVGGAFTRLELNQYLAAVNLETGAVVRPFNAHFQGQLDPETPCTVRALTVISDNSVTPPALRLIVGGNFTQVDSVVDNRAGLAALLPESGELDLERFTEGVSGGYVDALLSTATTLYAGGTFTSVQARNYNLASFNLNGTLRTPYSTGGQQVLDLDIDPVSNRLFAAVGGTANRAMAFDANARTRANALWQGPRTGGNVQGIHFYAGNVYIGFHDGLFAEPDPYKLAALDAATGALEVDGQHAGLPCENNGTNLENCWLPTLDNTAAGQGFFGVWRIRDTLDPTTLTHRLLVGGDFTQISGVTSARRLAFFGDSSSTL